ncbi:peptide-methionine (S)-S-oxide reductase MsrA [Vibrio ostreicida]|uniref:Peptide methionine sulfoxide reductase MsrA n=1 Tax=Vibrio ostreicida TaxID=526588 RepID=A0ABT8BMG6_9VIBR|nr:peptide-methionine (S)-S-oxide reductase MsrA [Vibrio ostreicida]MDN3608321.1 peptide-methionine (S)-S-oxide reductase MsrA [Vibrio ostreicida]NPD09695.1 peptide-methionine (S)-S-oxide reductase MsrA [Vibrio ostreicida]
MFDKKAIITAQQALPGRDQARVIEEKHFVNQSTLTEKPAQGQEEILFGMGCFWGAERLFWQIEGVVSTSVGYSGGFTKNPTYEEVCSGLTGHTEVVRVVFETEAVNLEQLLKVFWERHNPTQGMRQGNDLGTQYRSAIYVFSDEQYQTAILSQSQYQALLNTATSNITTEIAPANHYYFAETYHQQYLAKNPNGYCGLSGTGVCFS